MRVTILIAYGIILLLIGIYSALKIKGPVDYFLAGKRNGLLQISGSLMATILGGAAILGTINLCETQGWAASWYILAASIGLTALLPISKKVSQLGKFTLPELIGQFYGETSRKVTSLVIPIAWLGIIAAQIIAASKIMVSFFNIDYTYGVFIAGTIFIAYTFIGGQVSILRTDFIQAIVILAGVIATVALLPSGDHAAINSFTISFPFNNGFSPFDLFILILTFSTTFMVGPDIYSRVFCARDEKTARQSVLVVLLILIPFAFLLAYIGVYANTYYPEVTGGSSLVNLVNVYLPEWAAGIMVAALLSAVMSSADTTLLTASMILSELINKDINNQRSFRQTRSLIILLGIGSMFISLHITSIVSSLLLALAFYSGAFIIPTAAALFKLPYNKKFSITAMLTGGTLALAGKLMLTLFDMNLGNWIIICGFVLNALLLFVPGRKNKIA